MNNNINDINVAWPKIKRSSKMIYDRGGFYNQPRLRIQKDGWIITATIISSINSKLITTDYTSIRTVYIPCVPVSYTHLDVYKRQYYWRLGA